MLKIMNKLKVKKTKEKKIIWIKFKYYINFIIILCCGIIAFNINPSNNEKNNHAYSNKQTMTYIFHDYAWNEYIMNDKIHWASSSCDYLFDSEVPNDIKWDEWKFTDSVSLGDITWNTNENNSNWTKDNQISINDVMTDLWVEDENDNSESDTLVISLGWDSAKDNNNYTIKEEIQPENNTSLTIEKTNNNSEKAKANNDTNNESDINTENNNSEFATAKAFTFIKEWRILPTLVSRTDLYFNDNAIGYINESVPNWENSWITTTKTDNTLPNYADCMTPWWYKIHHWDSVLAYKQIDNAPDICNIERRFCWKGKLSGTYTQQWCSINKDYTYEQRGDVKVTDNTDDFRWGYAKQNSDWSVTIKDSKIWKSSISDAPNKTYSDYEETYNIRDEEPGIEQTTRPHPGCTTPWWEKVKHWDFVQAFKHENWFSDAPCEAQIRLCSLWELMWTYTESTCKTRDSSFIDWVNGSPSRNTYSKEKIERIKKQIKNEKKYYEDTRKNAEKSTDSDVLDKILYILDQD